MKSVCAAVLAKLFELDQDDTIFSAPVSVDVPGYARLIPEPMDLGTMASKHYSTVCMRGRIMHCSSHSLPKFTGFEDTFLLSLLCRRSIAFRKIDIVVAFFFLYLISSFSPHLWYACSFLS